MRYIPQDRKVYSSRQKGIFLTAVRYIPHGRKVYSSRQKGIFLTAERYIPHGSIFLYFASNSTQQGSRIGISR